MNRRSPGIRFTELIQRTRSACRWPIVDYKAFQSRSAWFLCCWGGTRCSLKLNDAVIIPLSLHMRIDSPVVKGSPGWMENYSPSLH
ncbi:hypothetical protein TNCT_624251 [Trichonephila clavata]|uniref:Uncharacterized protein n=1 Tax=Trichonephila clavata TaxID=2740835 RepID=A0A8X6FWC8_TRICU|nr:hypothetical protein TNCT_624251 [Trichonephila clavata]